MVEWVNLASNGLWVLGAAIILAAFGVSCYGAQRLGERLRLRLAAPGFQLSLALGLLLFSLGMAMLGDHWWERTLWGLLCATSVWQLWAAWRRWTMGDD